MKKVLKFFKNHLNFVILSLLLLVFFELVGLGRANAADSQLRATIGPNKSYVILENSQIYVKYEPFDGGSSPVHPQFAIRELRIKSAGNEDQVGTGPGYIDADAGRWGLASATIVDNGTAKKTVRLVWNGPNNNAAKQIIHEVSIFPNSRYLKIDYLNNGMNIVDIARPGGTKAGKHVAFGHSGWKRDYITHNYPMYKGSYYNRYPADGVNDPANGGSLNYNGHFIAGVYNPSNGRGIGRAIPVSAIDILKLLLEPNQRRGLELFPYYGGKPHPLFTSYLYVVTGGESEILSAGKALARWEFGSATPAATLGNRVRFDLQCGWGQRNNLSHEWNLCCGNARKPHRKA